MQKLLLGLIKLVRWGRNLGKRDMLRTEERGSRRKLVGFNAIFTLRTGSTRVNEAAFLLSEVDAVVVPELGLENREEYFSIIILFKCF